MGYLNYGVLIEIEDDTNFNYRLAAKQNTQMYKSLTKEQKELVDHWGYRNRGKQNVANSRKLLKMAIDGELAPIPTPEESVKVMEYQVSPQETPAANLDVVIQAHSEEIKQKEEIIANHITQAEEANKVIKDLENKLKVANKQIKKVTIERDNQFTQVLKIEGNIAYMEEKCDVLTKTVEEMTKELAERNQQIKTLQEEIQNLDVIVDQSEELESLRKENHAKDVTIKELKKYFGKNTQQQAEDDTWMEESAPTVTINPEAIQNAIEEENQVEEIAEGITPIETDSVEEIDIVGEIKTIISKSSRKTKASIDTVTERFREKYPHFKTTEIIDVVKNSSEFGCELGYVNLVKR